MAKQMHQIDDDEDPGKGGIWRRFDQGETNAGDSQAEFLRPEAREEVQEAIPEASGAGEEDYGMGRKNPFDNWRVNEAQVSASEVSGKRQQKVNKGIGSVIWHTISTVFVAGVIAATLFSLWMPASFIPGNLNQQVADAVSIDTVVEQTQIAEGVMPVDFPTNRVGIVVGHRGHDSGAVCANGLTELEINSNVATYVQQKLIKAGYEVDLLDEFDARLANYQAGLILSVHSDSCDYINDSATGFKVAAAFSQKSDKSSSRLVDCVADRYAKVTGLRYHYQSVTTDMTKYHIFDEINPYTTAGIIELGFMNLDQEVLTSKPEMLAEGIAQGIGCYMNNEEATRP